MSGAVQIEIRETATELKHLMRQEKDAQVPTKTASSLLASNPNGRQCIVCCCETPGNIVPQYKDGCLAIVREG